MTAQEYVADATVRAAASLTHFIDTTPPEKQDWTPTVKDAAGMRSALDMTAECILVNHMIAQILQGNASPDANPSDTERGFTDWTDARAKLAESAELLAEVIRTLPDEALTQTFVTRRGEMPGFLVIELALRNMHYHVGQVNQLQLLYGDTVFHFPTPKK